jgi:vacuolar-type H+-ATPase subunit I/STV1
MEAADTGASAMTTPDERAAPSKEALGLIEACAAAHFYDGLCPECVDSLRATHARRLDENSKEYEYRIGLENAAYQREYRRAEDTERRLGELEQENLQLREVLDQRTDAMNATENKASNLRKMWDSEIKVYKERLEEARLLVQRAKSTGNGVYLDQALARLAPPTRETLNWVETGDPRRGITGAPPTPDKQ